MEVLNNLGFVTTVRRATRAFVQKRLTRVSMSSRTVAKP